MVNDVESGDLNGSTLIRVDQKRVCAYNIIIGLPPFLRLFPPGISFFHRFLVFPHRALVEGNEARSFAFLKVINDPLPPCHRILDLPAKARFQECQVGNEIETDVLQLFPNGWLCEMKDFCRVTDSGTETVNSYLGQVLKEPEPPPNGPLSARQSIRIIACYKASSTRERMRKTNLVHLLLHCVERLLRFLRQVQPLVSLVQEEVMPASAIRMVLV